VRSEAGLILAVTLLGEIHGGGPITRGGAKLGDAILVTGRLGASAAGLAVLERSLDSPSEAPSPALEEALSAHLEPKARCREGMLLAETGLVHAMIDVSDGLWADLEHICDASGVGAEVEAELAPVAGCCEEIGTLLQQEPLAWAMEGGEDYELLFTCSWEDKEALQERIRRETGTPVTTIGRITEGRGVSCRSYRRKSPEGGFRHF